MYDGRTPAHVLWRVIIVYVFVSFIYNFKKYPGITQYFDH